MKYALIENGAVVQISYQPADGHIECPDDVFAGYLFDGTAFTAPPAGQEELDPKLVGIAFDGVMCSATKDDQNGLMAIFLAIQMQGAAFPPTRFKFENGANLVINVQNFQAFTAVWLPFRQSFFAVES